MKCLRVHAEGYRLGVWTVLHDAAVDDSRALLFGHLHPCLRSALAPGEAACYLVGPNRILLPAWCDHAAGVSIFSLGDWPDTDCFAIASEQVVALGQVTTLRGKLSRRYKPFKIGSGLGT
jgi:metallophosphoesterase superfamily enzyme